ncbi:MAG TPA: UDP-galactose-lipid carrier transferase [Solirubrobacterales bacterium]|nr:UDP-galactose-lipid carrier transferase [Solirubrobacterales bacterium]
MGRLDEADLTLHLDREGEERGLKEQGKRLTQLRLTLGGLIGESEIGPPLAVVFEGWDASGKGGAIKRLTGPLDPRHVRVSQFAAPTPDEKRHHFLGRFWPALPGWGGMTIFDRSWYGRVLVERVEEFASEEQWKRGYEEINAFEQTLANEGSIIVKFWLHVSPEEQLKRFEARADDPLKSWKLTEEDWRNRDKRPQYEEAVEEMLERTDQPHARWHVVPGDSKRFARVEVMRLVNEEIERGMRRWGQDPPPAPDPS